MRLHDFLDYWARLQPDAELAVQSGRRSTYRDALANVNRLANAFVVAGLQPGDRVAIIAKNSIEYLLTYFVASRTGVVLVPLNYRLAPPEWTYILNDARPRLLIAAGDYCAAVDTLRAELRCVERFLTLDAVDRPGWERYDIWIAAQPDTPPARDITDEQDVYQMYTSATTGRPKGVVLRQRSVAANILQSGLAFQVAPGERCLAVLPLFHAAVVPTAFSPLGRGAGLYIMPDFQPAEVVRVLSEERIAFATLVPAMIQACLVHVPDIARRRYDRLRLLHYGASPIAEHTLRQAIEVFGCDFMQSYGMTEATQALTYLTADDHRRALAGRPELLLAAGRPAVGTEVRIVDASDVPLPHGTPGEIVARGPQLMRGYWNLPAETAAALRGGWLHTGDVGILDREGYLFVQDRLKDMIVSGGENVYPRAVEDVLFQHPAVADAAVVGVPDERWGETVKAFVVLRAGMMASEVELIDFCRGRLGGFERPRSVEFVDALPRNPSGKVLKRVLREPYWSGRQHRGTGT
jgi:acyl-CoA synthetase (AMP-forming)/AMP-acid ligase II